METINWHQPPKSLIAFKPFPSHRFSTPPIPLPIPNTHSPPLPWPCCLTSTSTVVLLPYFQVYCDPIALLPCLLCSCCLTSTSSVALLPYLHVYQRNYNKKIYKWSRLPYLQATSAAKRMSDKLTSTSSRTSQVLTNHGKALTRPLANHGVCLRICPKRLFRQQNLAMNSA